MNDFRWVDCDVTSKLGCSDKELMPDSSLMCYTCSILIVSSERRFKLELFSKVNKERFKLGSCTMQMGAERESKLHGLLKLEWHYDWWLTSHHFHLYHKIIKWSLNAKLIMLALPK